MSTQNESMLTFSSQVKRSVTVSAYKVRFSDSGTYTYSGLAVPGTITSASSWQIKRITNATGDVDWADGDLNFNNSWDGRESITYS